MLICNYDVVGLSLIMESVLAFCPRSTLGRWTFGGVGLSRYLTPVGYSVLVGMSRRGTNLNESHVAHKLT